MGKKKAKVIFLIILGIAFFIVVYYQLGQSEFFGGASAIANTALGKLGKHGKNPIKYDVPALRLDILSLVSPNFDPSGRNLFKYDKPKPTPEEIEAMEKAREEARLRAMEEQKKREALQRKKAELAKVKTQLASNQPPPPPDINFRFVGYLGKPTDKIAVLEKGEDLYFGKEEEIITEHFKIVKIDFDSVIIGYSKPEWESQTKILPLGK